MPQNFVSYSQLHISKFSSFVSCARLFGFSMLLVLSLVVALPYPDTNIISISAVGDPDLTLSDRAPSAVDGATSPR